MQITRRQIPRVLAALAMLEWLHLAQGRRLAVAREMQRSLVTPPVQVGARGGSLVASDIGLCWSFRDGERDMALVPERQRSAGLLVLDHVHPGLGLGRPGLQLLVGTVV